jgi:hypothetical protein
LPWYHYSRSPTPRQVEADDERRLAIPNQQQQCDVNTVELNCHTLLEVATTG